MRVLVSVDFHAEDILTPKVTPFLKRNILHQIDNLLYSLWPSVVLCVLCVNDFVFQLRFLDSKKWRTQEMTPIGFGPLSDRDVRRFVVRLRRQVEARCELQFATPYQLLVAVVLSAQATDTSVNAATPGLFAQAPDPAAMVNLGPEKILTLIRRIGLAPTKARHVYALSQLLIERHGGQVPADRESLEALPGVGRKTANVVLDHAFGQPTLAVDTHVHRVANRLGICRTNLPEKTEQVLLQRIPPKLLPSCHLRLVLFGRYTCIARNPQCPTCFARDLCTWPEKRT